MTAPTRRARRGAASRGVRRSVVATSTFNVVSTATAGIIGVVIARSLGPAVKGEYAAIMVWFGLATVIGGLGQSAATTFFVARAPVRAPDYVAISRTVMVGSGMVILAAGLVAAPLLGSGGGTVVWGYRLMFATCLAALVGVSYTFALQGASIGRWNLARVSQPVCYLAVVLLLHAAGLLTLTTALLAFAATTAAQTLLAYRLCAREDLAGGRASVALARPLTRYGAGQLAATVPGVVICRLDHLLLSLTVDPAVLGNYAVAASLTTLAVPITAGVGSVAFPRIAAQRERWLADAQLHRRTVAVSAGVALVLMLPLAALAPWLIPWVFGSGFDDAVGLVALLVPRGVFLACQHVCADLLRGHGRPFAVARAQGVAAGLMVVLLCALIPTVGVAGAAIAASASAGASFLLLLRALSRALPRDHRA